MAVRYIRVNPVADIFVPVDRPTGNVAIVGAGTAGTANSPVSITSPSEAATAFGSGSELASAIVLAYDQTPGPSLVIGVRLGGTTATDLTNALTALENESAQFVVVANRPLTTANSAAITALRNHVNSVSTLAGDGKERMGVAMLAKGTTDTTIVTGPLVHERMIYIAHKSDQDAAAAVAGTVAGYQPHISMLLKQVAITSEAFTSGEIDTINGQEANFDTPPQGRGVNWFVDPDLIPGRGIYLGEGYTGNVAGKKFIDIVRTIDDVSFRLKARLIRAIGTVRISRTGLRALRVQMEAVLDPLVQGEVIESYVITIPILSLLDKDPTTLTAGQLQAIKDAQDQRLVQVLIAVDYAGAIHRLAITLKFE
jgi:hypothetical protein